MLIHTVFLILSVTTKQKHTLLNWLNKIDFIEPIWTYFSDYYVVNISIGIGWFFYFVFFFVQNNANSSL